MKVCTKVYGDIPFAHRAPFHDGHCKLLHGHNWTFTITFGASETDDNGFVVDFGKLKELKRSLDDTFDHALVLSANDPERQDIEKFLDSLGINNVRMLDDCSCEGIAKFVFHLANSFILVNTKNRAYVEEVTVHEDSRNSATYAVGRPASLTKG